MAIFTSEQLPISFGDSFMDHHAGQIVQDPQFAIIELVANCWDAGATKVHITWPEERNQIFKISDNGIGMTLEEFKTRWTKLNYTRLHYQGKHVIFPKGKTNKKRTPFGKNGIGRHAMFCFCDEYFVETSKDGEYTRAQINKMPDASLPFQTKIVDTRKDSKKRGTNISGLPRRNTEFTRGNIVRLIGSKFVADPEFEIFVNEEKVVFEDIEHLSVTSKLEIPGIGTVIIKRFEGDTNKTTMQQGVAWWVNNRLVGLPSWDGVNGRLIDGRNSIAKRTIYIIQADFLKPFVKPDWSGFRSNPDVVTVNNKVYDWINEDIILLSTETRKEKRKEALQANRTIIVGLPKFMKQEISNAIDDIQKECPTIGVNELQSTVKVLALMEKSRSGYSLLEKLAAMNPGEVDTLNVVLEEWSVHDVRKVMNELNWRLKLIDQLDRLVDNPNADELHDLQPLFERGLWIFGPEFESISYTSNRTLATVVKEYFGEAILDNPGKRPDFVILPDSSIGVYACDSFDENHNIDGIDSVVIVELKKGGFEIGFEEKDQATQYARAIRSSGNVNKNTKITCYVLGSTIDPGTDVAEPTREGSTVVIPRRYKAILGQAKARTFNLLNVLEKYVDEQDGTTEDEEAPSLFQD